jgi:ParB family transcriptional regulator, chromosome partitioning protein
MCAKRTALGKGLEALLSDASSDITGKNPVPINTISEIAIGEIEANPYQPREQFEDPLLEELAESIKTHGIIQPVTVRKIGYGKYQLISGERRTRAAIRAGLKNIPAYVRVANDQNMLEMSLIENIHREDLNAIEIAISYKRLLEECALKQEDLAKRIGINRTTVTNYLRLLKLPAKIQLALRDKQLSMSHARSLINIEDPEMQLQLYHKIMEDKLSVRDIETLVKKEKEESSTGTKAKPKNPVKNPFFQQWEKKLTELTKSKVKIREKNDGKGEIIIPFNSENDLQEILDALDKK